MNRIGRRRRRTLAAALAGAMAAAGPGAATSTEPAATSTEPAATDELAACFDAQLATTPFAGAALVQRGDESFVRTAGFRDADQRLPVERDTRFRLASVTKTLTRTAIARLVDQGRVALDAPVARYLDNLPAEMGAATIEQLLHHRSGVPSLIDLRALTPDELRIFTTAQTARARLPVITARPLEFAPGERQSYSNGGYFLLGAVVEAVSGRDFEDFMAEEIFRPLGMADSGFEPDSRTAMPMSRMPESPGQPLLAAPRPLTGMGASRGSSAGGAIATVDDLARLGRALVEGRFISPEATAQVFSRRGPAGAIWQNGGNIGQNADFYVFAESGWVVAVLSNLDPPAAEAMGRALSGVVAGRGCRTARAEDFRRRL